MQDLLKPKIVSFNKIKKLWKDNKRPTQLYIHSAFCKSICNFCIYRGGLDLSKHSTLYTKYFNEYLPNQVSNYLDIIKNQTLQGIYFGGGTPNIEEDLANLKPTFDLLHDIPCIEKTIELHFGLPITDKTIEILAKEHFNSVILCIQTLDETKLKEENRLNIANNDLDEIIGKLHQININVGIDLIAFPDNYDRAVKDMEKLMSLKNKPDEVTILHKLEPGCDNYTPKQILSPEQQIKLHLLTRNLYETIIGTDDRSFTFILRSKFEEYDKSFYSFRSYQMATPDDDRALIGIGSTRKTGHRSYSVLGRYIYFENADLTKNKVNYALYQVPTAKECIKNALKDLDMEDIFRDNSSLEFKIMYPTPEFVKDYQLARPSVLIKYKR